MILVSVIPLLLYLLVLKSLDSFRIVHWRWLVVCMAVGCGSCLVAWAFSEMSAALAVPFYAPLIEEILKALVALCAMRLFRIVFFAEALCYGAAIGAGFSLVENIIYIYFSPDMLFATALFRGLGTSMLHIGCSSLFLVLWLLAKNNSWKYVFRLWGILPCILIHALYNLHLFQPLVQMVAVVVIFLVIFLCVSNYNEKCIGKWLDQSMMYDIDLLSAIKDGTLPDTKAGQYLMSVKEQFDPYVFLDIICYVQLYLELTITAKSRMMLRESGLIDAESEDDKSQRTAMLKEFHTLRGNIGKMGEIILHPIVKMTAEDKKLIGMD